MSAKNLYKVEGGIGKSIMFTGLINELVKRDGESIVIETSYPEVFLGLEGIDVVYNGAEPKDFQKFYNYFDNIYDSDPYTGNFIKGNVHVLDSWRLKLGLENEPGKVRLSGNQILPVLNNDIQEEEYNKIKDIIGDKPYFVIQISGGQSPYEFTKYKEGEPVPYDMNNMRAGRNMGKMDDLYNELKKQFPDHTMVQFGLPNEPQLKDAVQIQMPYRLWFKVFEEAEFFVGIDSMLSHAMAAYKKPGMVFWDMNSPEQFGWSYNGRMDYKSSLPNGVHINSSLAKLAVNNVKNFLTKTVDAEAIDVDDTCESENKIK